MQTVHFLTTNGIETLTPTFFLWSRGALVGEKQPSKDQTLESAWKQIIPWLTGRGSIRCTASNGLEFNYVKNELRLKDGNKQGALMFYSSHTPKYLLH